MSVELIDPTGLPQAGIYHHVAVATGTRSIHVAGQVAVDFNGNVVGAGDLASQVEQCYLNIATALAAAGATFGDVVKLTVYVVDWTPDKMAHLVEGIRRANTNLDLTHRPPFTGIGVNALAAPEFLVEIEATAVAA